MYSIQYYNKVFYSTESRMESHSFTEYPQHSPEHCHHWWGDCGLPSLCLGCRSQYKWASSHSGRLCAVWDVHYTVVWATELPWYLLQVNTIEKEQW